jgi:hypothetical protein
VSCILFDLLVDTYRLHVGSRLYIELNSFAGVVKIELCDCLMVRLGLGSYLISVVT